MKYIKILLFLLFPFILNGQELANDEVYDGVFHNSVQFSAGIRAPFSEYNFRYTGDTIKVKGVSTIAATYPTLAHLTIMIDGDYFDTLCFNSAEKTRTVVLPHNGNTREISIVEGGTSDPSGTILGTRLTGLTVDENRYQKIIYADPHEKIVFITNSIGIGHGSDVAAVGAFTRRFKSENYIETAVYGYGYAELLEMANTSAQRDSTVDRVDRMMGSPTVKKILIEVGTNDYFLSSTDSSTFLTRYRALVDALHTQIPTATIYCMAPIRRCGSEGDLLVEYRVGIEALTTTRDYTVFINGFNFFDTDGCAVYYDDSVHPNELGHEVMKDSLYLRLQPDIGGDYYVANWGSDDDAGTWDAPFATFGKAKTEADAGDTVYFRGGVWYMTAGIDFTDATSNDGSEDNPIVYINYPGEKPIFDWSQYDQSDYFNYALSIEDANEIVFDGLTFRNILQTYGGVKTSGVAAQAITAVRSFNMTYKNLTIHNIGGRAFNSQAGLDQHPEISDDTTRLLNNDFYDLCDSLCVSTDPETCATSSIGGWSDGIKIDHYVGMVVIVEGNRIWHYGDNAIDNSSIHTSIIRNNWVWRGGDFSFTDADGAYDGEGSGIKFGSISQTYTFTNVLRTVTNNLSAYHIDLGFDESNSWEGLYPMHANVYNNTVYKTQVGFGNFSYAVGQDTLNYYKNNLAYLMTADANTTQPSLARSCESNCALWDSYNSWDSTSCARPTAERIPLTDADFLSLDSTQLYLRRKADNSLPDITFLKLASTSGAIDAGIDVGLDYIGDAPDLGYAEYGTVVPDKPSVIASVSSYNANSVTLSGNVVDEGDGTVTLRGFVLGTTSNPTVLNNIYQYSGGLGTYSSTIKGLKANTIYHIRGFATSDEGIGYSLNVSFTTPALGMIQSGGKSLFYNGKQIIY